MSFETTLFESVTAVSDRVNVKLRGTISSTTEGEEGLVLIVIDVSHDPERHYVDGTAPERERYFREDVESRFQIEISARISNPMLVAAGTTYLTAFGGCFTPKIVGLLMEALTSGYNETAGQPHQGWSAAGERADAIAKHVRTQVPKLHAKVMGAIGQCAWPFK